MRGQYEQRGERMFLRQWESGGGGGRGDRKDHNTIHYDWIVFKNEKALGVYDTV